MSFQSIGGFIRPAIKKMKFEPLAVAGTVCRRVNGHFFDEFPEKGWHARKFVNGELTLEAKNSASVADLYFQASDLKKELNKLDLPAEIKSISVRLG